MSAYWLSLISSFAVICAVLWRLALCTRPHAGLHLQAAWLLYGVVHIALLLSVFVRVTRLLCGHELIPHNTALFYLLVAVILLYPPKVKA